MPTNIPDYLREVHPAEHAFDLLQRTKATQIAKARVRISVSPELLLDNPVIRQAALWQQMPFPDEHSRIFIER